VKDILSFCSSWFN